MSPAPTPAKITFTVTERFVNLSANGASVCQVGVDDDGHVVLAFPNQYALATVVMVDGPIRQLALQALDATLLYQEAEPDMTLPRYRRTTIGPPQPPSVIRMRVSEGGTVSKRVVEDVVEALVASMVAEPHPSAVRRAAISREIAERFGIAVMSVAGIRASLTKNSYGDLGDLLAAATKAAHLRAPHES